MFGYDLVGRLRTASLPAMGDFVHCNDFMPARCVRRRLAVLVLAGTFVPLTSCARAGTVRSSEPAAPAAANAAAMIIKGPLCSPLALAGIVVGVSERRDVVALHGAGQSVPPEFNDSALAYLSKTRTEVMIVEFGTDDLVAHVTIRRFESAPPALQAAVVAHVSQRLDAASKLGPAGVLRLGQSPEQVRDALGAPQEMTTMERWTYFTDYGPTECVASEDLVVVFSDGVSDRILLEGGD